MSSQKVRVDIVGDNKKLKSSIKDSEQQVNSFGKKIQNIGKLIAGAFAVRAVVRFASESLKAYNVQAQAEEQLLVALKGREDAQRGLIAQAKELQKLTLFGDEETIRAQALIAAFVKEEDQIRTIIPLVQDLAAAKGMDLAGAADLVSKTLGSSTNALSRYGIEVTGAVGSTERLTSLSKGLSNAFEGQAQAAAKAGTGGLQQLQNRIGDLREAFGGWVNDIITAVLPALNKMVDGLELVFKGIRKIKEEAWDDATRQAIEQDRIEVEALAERYLELGVAQTKQEAQQKAVNDMLLQYHKILGNTIDEEVIARTEKQIAALRGMTTARIEANIAAAEQVRLRQQLNEVSKDEGDLDISGSLIDVGKQVAGIVEMHRKWEIATRDTANATDILDGKMADMNATMEAGLANEPKISAAFQNYKSQMADLERQVVSLAASIAGDLAFAFGEAAGGMDGLSDTLAELGIIIADSLGNILIAAGVQMGVATPQGLGLIMAGLTLKVGAGIVSGIMQNQGTAIKPQDTNSGDSRIYGNDIRTAYDYSASTNSRVG